MGLLLLLTALVGGATPGAVDGQVPTRSLEELVGQRRLELRAARAEWEAARSAFEVVERQFSAALDEVSLARRSGDDDRLERAYARAQDRSVPFRDQERRLEETRAQVVAARRALIEAITARLEQLVDLMDAAPTSRQRAELDALFGDLNRELQSLEAEEEETFRLEPVVLPGITFDPRDGPEDLRAKAQILERKAAEADSVIQNAQRQIEALSDRLRLERQRRDLIAGVDRFDDTRVPVVTTPVSGERGATADSTGAGSRPLTLEERIQILRDQILQFESYRDQLLLRAQQFRQRVGSVA